MSSGQLSTAQHGGVAEAAAAINSLAQARAAIGEDYNQAGLRAQFDQAMSYQTGALLPNISASTAAPTGPFHEAMRQVGMPRNDVYSQKTNGDVVLSVKEHLTETVKWHKAMIKVFEFMEAQLNIDLFKDDAEAKAIYTAWISKGLMRLRDEAGGGVMR